MKKIMKKRNTIIITSAVLAVAIILIGVFVIFGGHTIGKQNVSVYLDRTYAVKDNKIIPAEEAKPNQNHGHFFFKTNHHFYYEGVSHDSGDTHQLIKGTYSRSSKNLIVLNVTWFGLYDESHGEKSDFYSTLIDNTDDDYYKLYMKQDNNGKITAITDYYNDTKSGGPLEKSGKAVRGGAIDDPVYLYKSARYGK